VAISRIKLERLNRRLRQWDLAQKVGISESMLSKIETGRIVPTPSLCNALAAILNVPEELLEAQSTRLIGVEDERSR
jgi:transcriptional regulator with XRE-family HTH domain